tara:strand:- start:215 stop:646 length:432 start_codon:yes stop_codon:yes gene_type:complete
MEITLKPMLWAIFMYLILNNCGDINKLFNPIKPARQIEQHSSRQSAGDTGSAKVVVFYSMEGCGYCKKMKETHIPKFKKYCQENNIKFEEVDAGENRERVQKASIQGFPTLRIEEGEPSESDETLIGYHDKFSDLTKFADKAK